MKTVRADEADASFEVVGYDTVIYRIQTVNSIEMHLTILLDSNEVFLLHFVMGHFKENKGYTFKAKLHQI